MTRRRGRRACAVALALACSGCGGPGSGGIPYWHERYTPWAEPLEFLTGLVVLPVVLPLDGLLAEAGVAEHLPLTRWALTLINPLCNAFCYAPRSAAQAREQELTLPAPNPARVRAEVEGFMTREGLAPAATDDAWTVRTGWQPAAHAGVAYERRLTVQIEPEVGEVQVRARLEVRGRDEALAPDARIPSEVQQRGPGPPALAKAQRDDEVYGYRRRLAAEVLNALPDDPLPALIECLRSRFPPG